MKRKKRGWKADHEEDVLRGRLFKRKMVQEEDGSREEMNIIKMDQEKDE